MNAKVCIAKILTAHGVRGLVKVDCYLENPEELESYNPLTSADGKSFILTLKNSLKGKYLAEVKGIGDRNDAEKLRNIELFTDRQNLPEAEDSFYHHDLIGLEVRNTANTVIGKIIAVENFGAGNLIEIKPTSGKNFYLPFTAPFVGDVDTTGKFVIVDQIEEFLA